jgi:hypothetical protein
MAIPIAIPAPNLFLVFIAILLIDFHVKNVGFQNFSASC